MSFLPSIFALLVAIIAIGGFVLWVWALVDAIRTPDGAFRAGNQLIWVIVIVFANVIGAVIYVVIGRPGVTSRGR